MPTTAAVLLEKLLNIKRAMELETGGQFLQCWSTRKTASTCDRVAVCRLRRNKGGPEQLQNGRQCPPGHFDKNGGPV
jgi:hypothetical protein